jgi:hypothetical protein
MDAVDGKMHGPDHGGQVACADPESFLRLKCSSPRRQGTGTTEGAWTVVEEYSDWQAAPMDVPGWGCMQGDDLARYLAAAEKKWPRLSRVMRAVFATPASSAWLESSFSIATWLADPRRTRLTPEHMADLTVLTCNREMAVRPIRRIAASYLAEVADG